MNARRITTLMGKELREFRANPAAIVPVVLLVVICTAIPFIALIAVPALTGESLTSDAGVLKMIERAATAMPVLVSLEAGAAVQAFFFQQFLLLFLIVPIAGASSLSAYSIVGEKQGRTLEPLLTTPMSTAEILVAKVLAAFLPSVAIEAVGLAAYFGLVAALAQPGVFGALFTPHTAVLVGLVGPLTALAALQATIAVSSRVNDPRSAQQIAMLLVLPLVGMVVGQLAGAFMITTAILLIACTVIAIVWILLVLLSVALFDRETILTRWK